MNYKLLVKSVFFVVFCSFFVNAFAQEKGIVHSIVGYNSATESIDAEKAIKELQASLKTKLSDSDRLEVTGFLASLQERLGRFQDAQKNYSIASNLSATVNASKTGKAIPDYNLLISAVRSALSCGDTASADFILSTSFISCTDSKIIPFIKLYAAWSWLCKAETEEETLQPVAVLQSLLQDPSASIVKPQCLLTLWYVTGSKEAATQLQKDYASSPEALLVEGSTEMMPAPFWYFVVSVHPDYVKSTAKKITTSNTVDSEPDTTKSVAKKTEPSTKVENVAETKNTEETDSSTKAVKQQLGFFSNKANAEDLVKRIKAAGFAPEIVEEKRPSGNTYYAVVVPENEAGNVGQNLKKAGFECYPVF